MQESEFDSRVDQTLEALELALDEIDDGVEYETSSGILTVEFDQGSTMIFSRQSGNHQLWVAARSGGFHFAWDDEAGDWRCTRSGDLFREFVTREMAEQGGISIEL